MRLSDFSVVAFDLDDTLYLERDYVRSGFQAVGRHLASHLGESPDLGAAFARCCWQLFLAGVRGRIFDAAWSQLDVPGPLPLQQLVDCYRTHTPQIQLLPDSDALLTQLHKQCRIWVITDGHLASQQAKLQSLALKARGVRVVCTDRWGREFWKPHPRSFQFVQETSGVLAHRCVYLGDNPHKDFATPREIGWATIRVRRVEGLHADQASDPKRGPDLEVPDLAGLLWAERRVA